MKRFIGAACVLFSLAGLTRAADVTDLVKQLQGSDPDARRAAAKSLSELGPEAKDAVPALVSALKDKDLFVRRFAAQALAEVGPDAAKQAVPALKAALTDTKTEVVEAAAGALGKMGAEGVSALVALSKEKGRDMTLRKKAIEAIGKAGEEAKSAVPYLVELMKEAPAAKGKMDVGEIRMAAIAALGDLGPVAKEAVPALEAAASGADKKQRELKMALNDALKKIKSKN
jgi:HEAT repeat protein